VLRGIVIGLGAAALNRFGWLEYLLGLFLLYTAAQVARRPAETLVAPGPAAGAPAAQDEPTGVAGRVATRLTRRGASGMLAVVIALGVTDVVFAFDSIPAVFGLTRDPFLVFSANVFALLGLRHLYFLVAGLLARLAYLQAGLCVILAFIGLKLLGEALRGSGVTRLGPVPVPQIGPWLSLATIVAVLAASALASIMVTRRQASQRERAGRTVCDERR
jgi:tellurite resistance protein TerC